jgi:hypothetical protein
VLAGHRVVLGLADEVREHGVVVLHHRHAVWAEGKGWPEFYIFCSGPGTKLPFIYVSSLHLRKARGSTFLFHVYCKMT